MRMFLSLLLMATQVMASPCPCSLDERGILSCDNDSIETLPEDLKLDTCGISPGDVSAIVLFHQPRLTKLEKGSFNGLHALRAIEIEYSGLQVVGAGSFDGLTNMNFMNIRHNNLSVVADGSFDDLIHLKSLNMERNTNLKGVVTKAWHFCDKIDQNDLDVRIDDQVISKWLEPSMTTVEYCSVLAEKVGFGGCVVEGDTLDCRGQEHHFAVAACKLMDPTVHPKVTQVLFNFPMDEIDQDVEDFHDGAENDFFKAFNSPANSDYTKTIETLPVYATLFDLNTLTTKTGKYTKVVDVKADTSYFSEPMTIDYHLKVNSRIASIKHPVTMNMSRNSFVNYTNVEPWAMKEEIINTTGGILMRSRIFGLIEILDEYKPLVHLFPESACQPARLNIEIDALNVTSWFDPTALALQYVCARTLVSTGSNMRLAKAMTNFYLGFAHGESVASNPRAQKAVAKFLTLKNAFDYPDIHNVPGYNLETLRLMAGIMQASLSNYRADERQMEDSIEAAMGRMEIVQAQYDIVKTQQEMYFEMEMAQLEEIWADSDTKWDFDFSHREGMNQAMQGAIDAMMNETFIMKDKELILLLAAAVNSVNHFQDAVEKFKESVKMYVEKTRASMELQTDFFTSLGENTVKMEQEQENFDDAIKEWKEEQEAKAANAIMGSIINIFMAFATGEFDPGAILGAMEDIQDIIATLEELGEVLKICRDILDILKDIDISDIEEMTNNLSTYYKDAINNAKGLAKVGPKFDEINNLADTRIDAVDAMTDNAIVSDTASMKFAMKQVTSSGNRLLEESSKFVDAVLQLAVFSNELKMAEEDLKRATEDVSWIEAAIDAFEKEKEDFWNNREEDMQEYEDEINKMKDEYDQMTEERREQYKKTITELFSKYQKHFNDGLAAYQASIANIIASIHNKWIGLKNASMGQRSLILILFIDYCDAKFYHSFQHCDQTLSPAMSDSFDVLLKKLADIQLDAITDHPNGAPTEFQKIMVKVEESSKLMSLKSTRQMQVNFANYDINDSFSHFARTRLTSIDIRLYDAQGMLIPSPGSLAGHNFLFFITYPLVFNDRTTLKEKVMFLGQKVFCPSGYYTTDEGDAVQTQSCTIDEEFRSKSYQPAPDGTFTIQLVEPAALDLDHLARIDLILGGSHIAVDDEEL